MNRVLNEDINLRIKENELSAIDWSLNELAWELYWWVDAFQIMFFRDTPVPIPALTFEKARITTLGHYRIGRNDFAVREQINLNKLHLNRPLWDILATLFHEMVHSWEYTYVEKKNRTKSWYHSKAFKDKMAEYGILCAKNGAHIGIESKGRFAWLLRQHGVDMCAHFGGMPDVFPVKPDKKPKGSSKLKKWSCGCTNVRVAIPDFEAKCLKCDNRFKLCE